MSRPSERQTCIVIVSVEMTWEMGQAFNVMFAIPLPTCNYKHVSHISYTTITKLCVYKTTTSRNTWHICLFVSLLTNLASEWCFCSLQICLHHVTLESEVFSSIELPRGPSLGKLMFNIIFLNTHVNIVGLISYNYKSILKYIRKKKSELLLTIDKQIFYGNTSVFGLDLKARCPKGILGIVVFLCLH